ncbi:MAG TPA: DUF1190 domain-containing protein [Allosphingosinicella sp.]
MDQPRVMKRSKRVALTTLTVASVATVQACGSGDWGDEPSVDAFPYASVAECTSAGRVPASECNAAYNQALANHEQAAPRFESQPLCEEQFGAGQCQQRTAGASSFWLPLLGGFMVGQMMQNNRPYYRYGGLYRSHRHNMWYTGGAYGGPLRQTGGGWRAGTSGFDRPTSAPAVRSRSSSASRGGFGSRSRSGGG